MEDNVPVTSVIKVNLTLQDLLVSYNTMVWQQRKRCSNKEGWCIRESQQRTRDIYSLANILKHIFNSQQWFKDFSSPPNVLWQEFKYTSLHKKNP